MNMDLYIAFLDDDSLRVFVWKDDDDTSEKRVLLACDMPEGGGFFVVFYLALVYIYGVSVYLVGNSNIKI